MEDEGEIQNSPGNAQRHRPFISAPPALSPHLLQSSSYLNMARDSKDPDGDSEMASSNDSIHTDSDGAGHGNGARTPTRQVHPSTAAAAASELSPPGSQPTLTDPIPNLATFGGVEALKDYDSIQQGNGQPFDVPVAAWKGKRAQEEYQRAMDNVIDQNFNLNEFGDPFDERDLEQKLL